VFPSDEVTLPFSELVPIGWDDRWSEVLIGVAGAEAVPGRVVRHDAVRVQVAMPDVVSLAMRPGLGAPVVGDWVAVEADTVVAVLPRRSLLRRRDAIADDEQALAANVDVLLIVCGLDRPVRSGRIQRAVALAWDADAIPVVVLTKADLVEDLEDLDALVAEAAEAVPAVDVVIVSSTEGSGLDEVLARARDRTVVLLGESGAGKSTLVNALIGVDVAATATVRELDGKGRHTTTTRQLHPLPGGGVLLDSPGIRAVGLWLDPEAVDAVFPEIEDLAASCRFGDCAHEGEPDCAVTDALASGALEEARFASWQTLRREAEASARTVADRRRLERRSGRSGKQLVERKKRLGP
jgi:ribosome biogenesis GTPase